MSSLPFEIKFEILASDKQLVRESHHFGDLLVDPKKDETLLSWIFRQSLRFQISPGEFVKSEQRYWRIKKNIEFYPRNYKKISDWLVLIDFLPQIEEFYYVFEERGLVNGGKDQQIYLSDWIDLENENQLSRTHLREIFDYDVRFCPKCWKTKENRYFKKIWRHTSVLVCPDHGIPLIHQCPKCCNTFVKKLTEYNELCLLRCQNCDLDILNYHYEIDTTIFSVQKKILRSFFNNGKLPSKFTLINDNIYGLPLSKEIFQFAQLMVTRIGYGGNYGYENAKVILMFLAKKQGQLPVISKDATAWKINYQIKMGRWRIFGIFKWDDFIKRLFGCSSEISKFYIGPESLDRAIDMIRSFKKILQRYPKPSDKNMGSIYRSILRGEWRTKNIFNWSDILRISFKSAIRSLEDSKNAI